MTDYSIHKHQNIFIQNLNLNISCNIESISAVSKVMCILRAVHQQLQVLLCSSAHALNHIVKLHSKATGLQPELAHINLNSYLEPLFRQEKASAISNTFSLRSERMRSSALNFPESRIWSMSNVKSLMWEYCLQSTCSSKSVMTVISSKIRSGLASQCVGSY